MSGWVDGGMGGETVELLSGIPDKTLNQQNQLIYLINKL
jgi:hypothetical protein